MTSARDGPDDQRHPHPGALLRRGREGADFETASRAHPRGLSIRTGLRTDEAGLPAAIGVAPGLLAEASPLMSEGVAAGKLTPFAFSTSKKNHLSGAAMYFRKLSQLRPTCFVKLETDQ